MNDLKIGISLLVQWYEIKILPEYIYSLSKAVEKYDGELVLDFCLNINQDLEQIANGNISDIISEYSSIVDKFVESIEDVEYTFTLNKDKPIGIGEFRRESNIRLAEKCGVIVWGETDALMPSQGLRCIKSLKAASKLVDEDKFVAFFASCKMWDDSWRNIEHESFRDKKFDPDSTENIWDLCHTTTHEEMEEINNVEDLSVEIVPPQFNGCQLIISSEVIQSGINIPESMFFMREDTAMLHQIWRNRITQYLFPTILGVHNRKHPLKRYNIKGEEHITDKRHIGKLRACHDWYERAEKAMNENLSNLYNPDYKPKTWDYILGK